MPSPLVVDNPANADTWGYVLLGGANNKIQHFRVQSIADEYLVCKKCDSDGTNISTTTEKVYRAPRMRVTQWDGLTIGGITYTKVSAIERSATDGVDTETHKCTPDYETPSGPWDGDIIKAEKLSTPVVDGDNTYYYEEITDGRDWCVD